MGKYGRQETEAPKKKSKKFNWNPFSHAPKPVRTGLGVTLNVLDKPGQATRSYLASLADGPELTDLIPGASMGKAAWHGVKGLAGKEHTSGTELVSAVATGDKKKIKKLPFGVDSAVNIVTDPTTYVSLGASSAAKQGVKVIAKELGEDVAESVVKVGAKKALTAAERDFVRRRIIQEGSKVGQRNVGKKADKILKALDKNGQGGLKVAGRSVPGLTSQSAVGRSAAKINPKTLIGEAMPTSVKGLVVRGAGVGKALGEDTRTALLDEVKLEATQTTARQAATDSAASNVAKAGDLDDDRIRKILLGTDVPSQNEPLKALKAEAATATKQAGKTGKAVESAQDKIVKIAETAKQAQADRMVKNTLKDHSLESERVATLAAKEATIKSTRFRSIIALSQHRAQPSELTAKAVQQTAKDTQKAVADYHKAVQQFKDKAEKATISATERESVAQARDAAKLASARTEAAWQGIRHAATDRTESTAKAVKDSGNTRTAIATAEGEGDTGLADVMRFIDTQRARTTAEQIDAGILKEGAEHITEEYIPRYFTKAGSKALKAMDESPVAMNKFSRTATALKSAITQDGRLDARKLFPDLNIAQINEWAQTGNLPEGVGGPLGGFLSKGKLIEDNPLVATVRRTHQADAAVAQVKLLERVAKLKGPDGQPLLHEVTDKVPAHLKELDLTEQVGKKYAGHPEVVKVLNEVNGIVRNDESIRALHEWTTKVAQTWRSLATLGPAFQSRNARGNLWLNHLAGYRHPKLYSEAITFQRAASKAFKSLGPDADMNAAIQATTLTARQKTMLVDMLDEGIIGKGFFDIDLAEGSAAHLRGRKPSLIKRIGPTGDNPVLKANRHIGSVVENNARVAHYIGAIDRLGDKKAAARSVKKFLFDYSDLTPAEKLVFKKIVPFYTFMRKNLPVEIEQAFLNPAKFTVPMHISQEFNQETGYNPMRGMPIDAADDILRIGLGGNSPEAPADSLVTSGIQQRAQALGGPLEPVSKTLIEQMSGASSFNGYPYRTDRAKAEAILRNLVPPYSKYQSAKKDPVNALIGVKRSDPAPEAESSGRPKRKSKYGRQ